MPQSAPVRSSAPSDMVVSNEPSSVMSTPATDASRLTADDAGSDVGSDNGSSVSLISVPSSEDEDDEAFYEDSRSHVTVTRPDRVRPGMEYVVLYDESSSEEE
jgi:next to BRCA1 gene 1 protein